MKRCILTLTLMLAGLTAHGQLDRSIRPQAAEARLPSIAEYSQFKLRNGLTVLVVENHISDTISNRCSKFGVWKGCKVYMSNWQVSSDLDLISWFSGYS